MKRFMSFFLVTIITLSLFPVSHADAAVKISKTMATMEVDSSLALKISGTKSTITWKTSKKAVAAVDSKGIVTAKATGETTITATVSNKSYSCIVNVVNSNRKELTAPKGTVTELSTGTYLIGEDFPAGKYDVNVISGSGNFFVDGNDTSINEIFAEEGHEVFDTHSYKNMRLLYGDTMKITSGVVLEFTKLD